MARSCSSTYAEKASAMAVSAVRNLWNTYMLDKPDYNDSNTEEDEEETAERRQLSIDLNQTLGTRQLLLDFDRGRPVLSLRAPLDLVNVPSVPQPRWPLECEVISDTIQHIEWDPPEPESFYQFSGYERTPMPATEERRGKLVYCSDLATKRPYFTCSRVRGCRGPIKNAAPCEVDEDDFTLEFESRFESGNLQKAAQVGVYDYELTLRTDLYTRKHTQWFYFRVRNMKAGVTYRFTIINMMKSSSLYNHGMRPLLYSERAAEEDTVGWQRTGSNIRYYRNYNQSTKENYTETIPLYSLTWTLQFPYDSDTCYLAHCYPYTYSHLQRYLNRVTSDPAVSSYCKLRVLCHSLAGNDVYVLTITSQGLGRAERGSKKAVVVSARVHPGETNSSWMMEGFLDFILGSSEDAQLLRDTFIFKVVPMLNPDGVVVGNYRCSLAGRDLNRNYKTILRDSFPCVWHTRNMVERLMAESDVVLYCDFHGHNRKNNVFMYGCNNQSDPTLKLNERVFPLMMSKNAGNKFSFRSCKFRVQKSKEGTGRISMWRLGIKNSYTMEATFGGSTLGDRKGTHFTTRDLKSLGFYFCDTLLDYCDPDPTKNTYCLTELAALLRMEIRERMGKDLGIDCNISVSDLETSTSGSNSSDSDGLPVHLLNQPEPACPETPVKKKKKRLRSHKERNKRRPDRATEAAVPESSTNESSLANTDKESMCGGRHRTKWQAKCPVKKPVYPGSTTHPGEVSQVTLWEGSEPVKDNSLESIRASWLHRRSMARQNLSMYTAASPYSDVQPVNTCHWRCASQLLHLSAFRPAEVIPSKEKRHHCPRQTFVSYKVYKGVPPPIAEVHRTSSMFVKMVPEVVSTKRLLSTFTTDKQRFGDRRSLRFPEQYILLGDSLSKSEQEGVEPEDESKGDFSPMKSTPIEKQNQRDLSPDPDPEPFPPVLRGKGLSKDTLGDKRHAGVLSPLKMELPRLQRASVDRIQPRDIRKPHSVRESPLSLSISDAIITRSSQSAPL